MIWNGLWNWLFVLPHPLSPVAEERMAAREVPRLAPGPLAPRIARLYVESLVQQGDPGAIGRGMEEMGARCVLPRRARAAGVRGSLKRLELFYTRVLGCEAIPPQREGAQGRMSVFYCPLGRLVFSPHGIPCASYCAAMARGVLGEAPDGLAVGVEQGAGGRCNIQISKVEPVSRKIHGMDIHRLKTIRDRLTGPSSAPVVGGVEARAVWEGRLNRSLVHIGPFTFQGRRITRPTRHFTLPFGVWCEAEEMMGVESPSDRIEPQEALLASLAACINTAIVVNASLEGIELEEMETIVRKKIDPSVVLGAKPPGPEPYSIVYEVRVKGKDLTEERLARLEEYMARSPVHGLLTFPQRMEGRIVAKKEEEEASGPPLKGPPGSLYLLFAATRGGATRGHIVEVLKKSPMNANQLATHLGVDYRTVTHHLRILEKNNMVTIVGEKYGQVYFLSRAMEEYYPHLARIMKEGTHA